MKILTKEILKKEFTVSNGNVDLRLLKEPFKLAENLVIDGYLQLNGNKMITELPKKLTVKGDLNINDTKIADISNGVKILGDLSFCGSLIKELPIGLEIGENLVIRSSKIKELPKKLKIGGNILMDLGQITKLPNDLELKGVVKTLISQEPYKYALTLFLKDLELLKTKKDEPIKLKNVRDKFILCDNLEFDGDLDLVGSKIALLSSSLKVKGKLLIDENQVYLLDKLDTKTLAKEILVWNKILRKFVTLSDFTNQTEKIDFDIKDSLEKLETKIDLLNEKIDKIIAKSSKIG